MTEIQERLFRLQDQKYRKFQCSLIPTVAPDTVIGVRMPALRKLAAEFAGEPAAETFISTLPHLCYEENNLHGLLISGCRDCRRTVELLDAFLPYVDNWATCDLINPQIFKKHLPEILPEIRRWMGSPETYTIRFGTGMLMRFYLDEAFEPEYLREAAAVRSEEYYVNMMTAWFFATALAKQYDQTLPYLEKHCLDTWTHNKTIRKAIESYRIPDEHKAYLRTLAV